MLKLKRAWPWVKENPWPTLAAVAVTLAALATGILTKEELMAIIAIL